MLGAASVDSHQAPCSVDDIETIGDAVKEGLRKVVAVGNPAQQERARTLLQQGRGE